VSDGQHEATDQRPAWLREIELAVAAHPQVLLTGNVHDSYRIPDPERSGMIRFMPLVEALWTVVAPRGYEAILTYQSGVGVRVAAPRQPTAETSRVVTAILGQAGVEPDRHLVLAQLRDLLSALVDVGGSRAGRGPVTLVLADAARLFSGELGTPEERLLLAVADRLAYQARPVGSGYHTIFWVLDREHDLPAWFATGNHTLRVTAIPEPDLSLRLAVAQDLVDPAPGPGQAGERPPPSEAAVRFAEETHGMRVRGMRDVFRLARTAGIPVGRIQDAVRTYRVGVPDNPWQSAELRTRLRTAEEDLSKRVLGQPDAVRRALDILARSVTGLSGAQAAGAQARPRGVLFFAGPTGVGKTELAKALAKLLFGDEQAYLRFDMSEFSAEHSEARLIGAPPGYVGHDAGGELTNGVREQPFRVVLFDEIEKAHPRLLDKFLQILDDGRLTDGRGGTVYFTETLIIFTTNLGVVVPEEDRTEDGRRDIKLVENVTPDQTLPEIEERIRRHLETFFRYLLGRPELYNRVQQNIVVFDFLRPPVTDEIAERAIDRVAATVSRLHDIQVEYTPEGRDHLRELATFDLRNGGRGIISQIESVLVNPLARELFERPREPGQALLITEVDQDGQNWRLVVK
jgi:energy-coupling factor transporter ATP-binding protein EcfA2